MMTMMVMISFIMNALVRPELRGHTFVLSYHNTNKTESNQKQPTFSEW